MTKHYDNIDERPELEVRQDYITIFKTHPMFAVLSAMRALEARAVRAEAVNEAYASSVDRLTVRIKKLMKKVKR